MTSVLDPRQADGRKVLRSSIREFLCSEAMFHLGVPTTRAGACITSQSTVERDMFYDGNPRPEQCAVVLRVAPTFLRYRPSSCSCVAPARPGCRAWGGVSRAVDLEFTTRSSVRCTKKTASLCCWTSGRDAWCARVLWPLLTDWRPPGCRLQRGLSVLDVTTLSGVRCSVLTT